MGIVGSVKRMRSVFVRFRTAALAAVFVLGALAMGVWSSETFGVPAQGADDLIPTPTLGPEGFGPVFHEHPHDGHGHSHDDYEWWVVGDDSAAARYEGGGRTHWHTHPAGGEDSEPEILAGGECRAFGAGGSLFYSVFVDGGNAPLTYELTDFDGAVVPIETRWDGEDASSGNWAYALDGLTQTFLSLEDHVWQEPYYTSPDSGERVRFSDQYGHRVEHESVYALTLDPDEIRGDGRCHWFELIVRDVDGDTAAARVGLRVGVKRAAADDDAPTATPTYTMTPTYTATATIPAAPMEAALVVPDTPTATSTPEVAAQSILLTSTPTPTNTPIYGPIVHFHANVDHGLGAHSGHDAKSSVTHHGHTHGIFWWVEPNTRRYGRNTPTPTPRSVEVGSIVNHWHKHDTPGVDSTPSLFANYVGWSPRLSISFVRNRNSSTSHSYVINNGNRPVKAELIGPDGSVISGGVSFSGPSTSANWRWVLEGVRLQERYGSIGSNLYWSQYRPGRNWRAQIPFSDQYGYTITGTDPYRILIRGPSYTRGYGGSYNLTLRLTDADDDVVKYPLSVRVVTATSTHTSTPTVTPTPTPTATSTPTPTPTPTATPTPTYTPTVTLTPRPPLFSVDKPNPLVGQSVTFSVVKPLDNAHHGNISQSQTRYQGCFDDDAANAAACGDWRSVTKSGESYSSPIARFYRATVEYVSGAMSGFSAAIKVTWHAATVTFSPASLSLRENEGVQLQNGSNPESLFAHDGFLYGLGGGDWKLGKINPATGATEDLGVLGGKASDALANSESTNGAAVVDGNPYVLSFRGSPRELYLNKIDMSKNEVTERVKITYVNGGRFTKRLHSLVSDGTTLWIIDHAVLRGVDLTTGVASAGRAIPGLEIASGAAQLGRLSPAAAYRDGQIYAFYREPTRGWRFKPTGCGDNRLNVCDAVRLNVYGAYDSAETLGGVMYGVSGGRLLRIDPES